MIQRYNFENNFGLTKCKLEIIHIQRIKRQFEKKNRNNKVPLECFKRKLIAYLELKYLNDSHNNQYLSSRNLTTCLLKFNGTVLLNHRLKPMNRPIAVNILRRRVCSKTEMTWSRQSSHYLRVSKQVHSERFRDKFALPS